MIDDDLVQETCARALGNMDQWQPGTHLSSWVFRITPNLWFDRQRAKKFRRERRRSARQVFVVAIDPALEARPCRE